MKSLYTNLTLDEIVKYSKAGHFRKADFAVPALRSYSLHGLEVNKSSGLIRVADTKTHQLSGGRPLDLTWLKAASETYIISTDPRDYIVWEIPIVTADYPNRNMDCLARGTLVQTNVGLIPIQDIPKSKATYVLTPKGPKKIHNWRKVGYLDTVSIHLSDGRTLQGTPDHEILVLNPKDLAGVWKPLGELSIDDFVICQTGDIIEKPLILPEAPSSTEFLEMVIAEREDRRYSRQINDITTPKTMTPELARLLGHLVAEGTVTHPNTVIFTNNDPALLDDFCSCWHKTFGLEINPNYSGGYTYGNGVIARQWLAQIGLGYSRANKKRVPWSILRSGKKLMGEFLRAYIAGDGCVSGGHIQVASTSKKLLKELQVLLLGFGIQGRLLLEFKGGPKSINGSTYECKRAWSLELGREASTKLIDQIGPIVGEKGKQTYEYEQSRNKTIPFAKEVIQHLVQERREGRTKRGMYQYRNDNDELVAGYFSPGKTAVISKREACELLDMTKEVSPELGSNLEFLCRPDIITCAISKVHKNNPTWVYDIGVEDAHCFIANGIVVHNCFSFNELAFFSPLYGQCSWETFRKKPTHQHHQNQDPTKAKGAILDVTFKKIGSVYYVVVACAYDRTKDKDLVNEMVKIPKCGFSMGALVSFTTCSICGYRSDGKTFCADHIGPRGMKKGQVFDGKIAAESCIVGDALVASSRGLIEMRNLRSKLGKGYKLAHSEGESRLLGWRRVGKKHVCKLSTTMGYELEVTEDHRILTLTPEFDLEFKEAEDIKPDDVLVLRKGGSPDKRVVSLKKAIRKVTASLVGQWYEDLRLPRRVTTELATVLGYLGSEGTIGDRRVGFSQSPELHQEFIDEYAKAFKKVFGLTINSQGGADRTALCQFLEAIGMPPVKSAEKRIPWCILRADRACQLAYLRAYIDGDGTIANPNAPSYSDSAVKYLNIVSKSEGMVRDLHRMLLYLGYPARCRFTDNSGANGIRLWRVEVHGREALELVTELKHAVSDLWIERQKRDVEQSYNAIPFTAQAITALRTECRIASGARGYYQCEDGSQSRLQFYILTAGKGQPYGYQFKGDWRKRNLKGILPSIRRLDSQMADKLDKLLDDDIFFDHVATKIFTGMKVVYDAMVAEDGHEPQFTANGIVVHNCHLVNFIEVSYVDAPADVNAISERRMYLGPN